MLPTTSHIFSRSCCNQLLRLFIFQRQLPIRRFFSSYSVYVFSKNAGKWPRRTWSFEFQQYRFCSQSPGNEEKVLSVLKEMLSENDGLEWYRFRVSTYNDAVQPVVRLPYKDDVMGVIVLSTPAFFETSFKKFLQRHQVPGDNLRQIATRVGPHPIRSFFTERFSDIEKRLAPMRVISICDFEPLWHRQPEVSLPICGHIAGAAYYHRSKVNIDPITGKQKLHMGIALHPKYGGHFCYRGVIVFPDICLANTFKEKAAQKMLNTDTEVDEAVDLITHHYRDNRYRDLGNPVERYSELQLRYFNTRPPKRWALIADWFNIPKNAL